MPLIRKLEPAADLKTAKQRLAELRKE